MKPAINDAWARPRAGEPPPVRHRNGNRHNRPRIPDITEVERQVTDLANRSTQDLRVAWRQLHRTGPPLPDTPRPDGERIALDNAAAAKTDRQQIRHAEECAHAADFDD